MKSISTSKAPKAVGPYSQAVTANGFLFTSGQIPLDPVSGEVLKGSISQQTELALKNLKAVIEAAGSSLSKTLKVTLYITDMNRFAEVNEVYARFFTGEILPARSCVQVSALPKGVDVEVDAIALL
ncbi:MAG: RidA family protein [Planctomycetota bacterium]|nr:RidA family protein [Planctomycetota bacterium]